MVDEPTSGNNPGPNGAVEPAITGGFLSIQEAVDLHVAQSQPPVEPAAPPEPPPVAPVETIETGSPDTAGTPAPVEPPDPFAEPGKPQVETFPKAEPEETPAEPVGVPPVGGGFGVRTAVIHPPPLGLFGRYLIVDPIAGLIAQT